MKSEIVRTVITAQPGWYVAIFCEGGEYDGKSWEDSFYLQPILAWEILRDRQDASYATWPITLTGSMEKETNNQWAVKTPDGVFEFVWSATFNTEAEALANARERHDEHMKWEREKAEQRKQECAKKELADV